MDDQPHHTGYVDGKFNTAFRYELADKTGKKVARAGLADLDICLPYTLAFVQEIESVEYPNHLVSLQDPDDPNDRRRGAIPFRGHVDAEEDTDTYSIAVLSNDLTTIAVPVEQTDDGVRILPLGPDVPRLFCDFPLLGTESFPFPVIINNPTFNPTEPRDGVFLTKTERSAPQSDHNRAIIEEALALYLSLLRYASSKRLARSPSPGCRKADASVHLGRSELVQDRDPQAHARHALLRTKIVRTAADTHGPHPFA